MTGIILVKLFRIYCYKISSTNKNVYWSKNCMMLKYSWDIGTPAFFIADSIEDDIRTRIWCTRIRKVIIKKIMMISPKSYGGSFRRTKKRKINDFLEESKRIISLVRYVVHFWGFQYCLGSVWERGWLFGLYFTV